MFSYSLEKDAFFLERKALPAFANILASACQPVLANWDIWSEKWRHATTPCFEQTSVSVARPVAFYRVLHEEAGLEGIMPSDKMNYDDAAEILTEAYSGSSLCNSSLTLWRSSIAGSTQ